MKYFWKIPPDFKGLPEPHISRVIVIVCCILAAVFALTIGVVTLDAETRVMEIMIWRLLVLPVLLVLMVLTTAAIGYLITRGWYAIANEHYRLNRQQWQQHAAVCIRLAEHHSLFPVDNAALKMIGLEGEMPAAKDIPRKLSIGEDEEQGLSRTQQTIKTLMDRLDISMIDDRYDRPEVWLYIRNASDSISEEVVTLLQQSRPAFSHSDIQILSELPERALLEKWTLEPFSGFRLLIVAELHADNDDDFCEYATALLFSRRRSIPDTRMPVWCFRSLNSEQHRVGKYLNVLFAAEQINPADLRHIWTGNLQGESLNLLSDAFTEVDTGVKSQPWHSMRLAETWTPGYQWLMLEWGARAIRNGQRAQLLATHQVKNQQVNLALISGETRSHTVDDWDQDGGIFANFKYMLYVLLMMGAEGLVLFISLRNGGWADARVSGWWFIGGLAFIIIFVMLIIFLGLYVGRCHQRLIEQYYEYK